MLCNRCFNFVKQNKIGKNSAGPTNGGFHCWEKHPARCFTVDRAWSRKFHRHWQISFDTSFSKIRHTGFRKCIGTFASQQDCQLFIKGAMESGLPPLARTQWSEEKDNQH